MNFSRRAASLKEIAERVLAGARVGFEVKDFSDTIPKSFMCEDMRSKLAGLISCNCVPLPSETSK